MSDEDYRCPDTLDMFEMKILHLTLKKKWFDMILSGEKTEEYREIKPYWNKRLPKIYTHIKFRNGYNTDSPEMIIELLGIERNIGRSEWGAPSWLVYVLRLGNIIETKNCNES